jgi:hypothetical protein
MTPKKFYYRNGRDPPRVKVVLGSGLTSDCWMVQVWGLQYCSGFGDPENMCDYLATEKCGGYRIRRAMLRGE